MQRLNIVSLVLAVMLTANFVTWACLTQGFAYGYQAAAVESGGRAQPSDEIRLPRTEGSYAHAASKYVTLGLLSLVLCVLLGLRNRIGGRANYIWWLIGVPILVVIFFDLQHVLGLKDPGLNHSLTLPYNSLLRLSASYDWIASCVVTLLFLLEIWIVLEFVLRKRYLAR